MSWNMVQCYTNFDSNKWEFCSDGNREKKINTSLNSRSVVDAKMAGEE